jgi:hypothetical protein
MFGAWHSYAAWINRQAPDLSFIPSYAPHVDRYGWYFGTLADRARFDAWHTVVGRVYREIASTFWWVVIPFGILVRERPRGYYEVALGWTAGTAVYLVLFLTLNEAHNYYQIPFIAPFCLWLAAPIHACWTATGDKARAGRIAAVVVLAGYTATSLVVASRRFYWTDPYQLAVGSFIRERTSDMDLIVMSHSEAAHGDPSFLFYARRYGWSVGPGELSPAAIEGLRPHGATLVATSTAHPPSPATREYLGRWPMVGSRTIGGRQVHLHRLAPSRTWP